MREVSSRGIVEELPELFPPRDELVGALTDRLVEAFEKSAMASEQNFGSLNLTKMWEIRDDVLVRGSRAEQRTSPSPRIHRMDGPHRANREPAHLNRLPRAGGPVEDPESCCSPAVVAAAAMFSTLFVILGLLNKMFSDDGKKGPKVTRVNEHTSNTQINSRGSIDDTAQESFKESALHGTHQ